MIQHHLDFGKIDSFLEILSQFGSLHGPVLTDDGVTAFRSIATPAELLLDYHRTLIPPKKYLLPPRECILTYTALDYFSLPKAGQEDIILLGLHPCDLHGINYLDRVFLENLPDPLYERRRDAVTLIGLSCEPDEFCFCTRTGTSDCAAFDLFLQKTDSGFIVTAGSIRGDAIFLEMFDILKVRGQTAKQGFSHPQEQMLSKAGLSKDTFDDNGLWNEYAKRCLSCGACSVCCPTCYCFDVQEFGRLDGVTADRLREWDNCLFHTHGEVAGGHNFRSTRQERFHYRFRHKFHGFGPLQGVASCVGCGRCREVCPVGIDLTDILKQSH